MTESVICLKPISALLTDDDDQPATYRIAAYQRGYRWSSRQVTQLLDDIWDFVNEDATRSKDAFYCLQPLVIKPGDGEFEVVDGQQRLTTILLILNFFNQRLVEDSRKQLYSITFETRAGFDEFLAAPSEEQAAHNVDFFHLYWAMQGIKDWFKDRPTFVNDIESALLNRTKVIWFQLAEGDHPVEAFTRLNAGKIPLTNDELIRALFLRRARGEHADAEAMQLRVANEWDAIEKALQEDAFWRFLSNENHASRNRIEFLFDLVARAGGTPVEAEHDTYAIFYVFNQKLKASGASLEQEWRRVKEEFMRLQEWFEDRVLYHIVGYLVNEGVGLGELRELARDGTKSEFEQKLRHRVFTQIIARGVPADLPFDEVRTRVQERLENLEYGSTDKQIRSLLLLFNVATLLQDKRSNMRFQFDSFKGQEWNIEHVRSIASEPPRKYAERQTWLRLCQGYLATHRPGAEKLGAAIAAFLELSKQDASDELFAPLYRDVLEEFAESNDAEVVHGISNLTLLDEKTNKSYKNAPFAVKRQRLLSLDQAGIFVPLCTRNVFLKCYSPQVDNVMFWSGADQVDYQNAMVKTLVGFFAGNSEEAA